MKPNRQSTSLVALWIEPGNSTPLHRPPDCIGKRGLLLIVALVTLVNLQLSEGRAQDFTFVTNADSITITGYTGSGGSVVIPDSINGRYVGSIGVQAFLANTNLTSLTMGNSLTSIGQGAFYQCANLTNIVMGAGLASIGTAAFEACSQLTSMTIGSNVTNIGNFAFFNCRSLTNIAVSEANSNFSSFDGVLFDRDRKTLLQCPGGKSGDYLIPNGVTSIGGSAFTYCTGLTSVNIPDSVTDIGYQAFAASSGMTSVSIGNGTTNIGDHAFEQCDGLKSVTIGNSPLGIGNYAFRSCTKLTAIYFKGNAPTQIGVNPFFLDSYALVYYLPGSKGWTIYFATRPTVLWNPTPNLTGPSNPFGFTITGTSNLVIVVEAATSLSTPDWTPASTNTLTDGSSVFSDPEAANQPARFYRLRSP